MKVLISLLLLICFCNIAISKGSRGIYYIKGIAYLNHSQPMRNITIELCYGNNTEYIKTNSKGEFLVSIIWEFPCLSGVHSHEITKEYIELMISRANPEILVFQYKADCIFIENFFYKFRNTTYNRSERLTFKQDLKF